MAKTPKPDDDRIPFTLRLPPDLHAMLSNRAITRSLNGEIIARLWASIHDEERLPSANRNLRIELDPGRAVGWAEIQEAVGRIVEAMPQPPIELSISVLTPEILSAQQVEQDRRNALIAPVIKQSIVRDLKKDMSEALVAFYEALGASDAAVAGSIAAENLAIAAAEVHEIAEKLQRDADVEARQVALAVRAGVDNALAEMGEARAKDVAEVGPTGPLGA